MTAFRFFLSLGSSLLAMLVLTVTFVSLTFGLTFNGAVDPDSPTYLLIGVGMRIVVVLAGLLVFHVVLKLTK